MSLKRLLMSVVVMVFAIIGWFVVVDAVWRNDAHARCLNDDGSACSVARPRQYAEGFRQGELRNTRRFEFPDHVKRKIRRWYANHPKAARTTSVPMRSTGAWWDDPFQASVCMMWERDTNWCLRKNSEDSRRAFRRATANTTYVTVKCSGAAVLGAASLRDGRVGWWGAGAGGLSCLYLQTFDKWWPWLYD